MKFDKRSLSPTAIVKDLQNAVAQLPDGQAWEDYFEGGAGRTIIELIAGSQAISNHYNLMRVRESSLQHAKLDSSVTELAVNKGVYRPPAKASIIEVVFNSSSSGTFSRGQVVGTYKNYDLIVLETTEYFFGRENHLVVAIGRLERYEQEILDATEFYQIDIRGSEKYLGGEFQVLTINNEEVILIDEELNLYDPRLPQSCVRLTYDYFSRLIFGDGIIGKKVNVNDQLVFSYISFGEDVLETFNLNSFNLSGLIDNTELIGLYELRRATPYINKEILRKIAIRNSVDGRWVQTQDYENGILREYGEYIADILVEDQYPAELITILPKDDYITDSVKEEITTLVNNKRGNATLVTINYLDPTDDDRLELMYTLTYKGTDAEEFIDEIIATYVAGKINKINSNAWMLAGADIAVDLTHLAPGGKFYADLDERETILPYNSIASLQIIVLK